ncbi:MAG: FtsW/RodA/SpoVE family cell cycle protein [Lachnospiraceae bacterium]|nr:FtsW/RodA/SpoVE family cell cycle protein [Lachnospiraceae bacterium]
MPALILEVSKYVCVMLMAIYIIVVFLALKRKDDDFRNGIYRLLETLTLLFFLLGMGDICIGYIRGGDPERLSRTAGLAGVEFGVLLFLPVLMRLLYRDVYRLLLCQMQMLLAIGFVILARLNLSHARRQFVIICVSLVLFLIVPALLRKLTFLKHITFLYGGIGIGALLLVFIGGRIINGSKINYQIFGLTFQPSEAVKLLFAFLIAGLLAESVKTGRIAFSAILAAVHVLILVASKDLGSALIFFVMYIAMLYVATGKAFYLYGGTLAGAVSAVAAYLLFSHVRSRVQVWLDPWADIDNKGYQVTQSLFGIATGGWFGMGLGHGSPRSIPFVEEDFIFSAVAEELGTLFGILLILLCLSIVLGVFGMAGRLRDPFYRLVAVGLGVCYGVQVVLTIGGGTGLIPLTGVTLPLISNGGTSALVSMVLFGILQGIYMLRMEEYDEDAWAEQEKKRCHKEWQQFLKTEEAQAMEREELLAEKEALYAELDEFLAERKEQQEKQYAQRRSIFVNGMMYTVVYLLMFGNILLFLWREGGVAMTNTYNSKRIAILERDNIRGEIYAADGTVLARTIPGEVADGREYPFGELYAHVVGYAAKGGAGIEREMQRYLITSDVTLAKKMSNDLNSERHAGNSVYTTLMPALQQTAYEALGNHRGAVVATDIHTGEILAIVSKPAFDPNEIEKIWDELLADEESGRLVDRAAQGQYPPGSTFKIFTALEYIRENPDRYRDYRFDCSGRFSRDGATIQCFHGTVHGEVDLTAAFAKSCNSSFADIGLTLDKQAFAKTLLQMHFNESLPFDLQSNPSRISMRSDLDTDEMMQTCIGQARTQMSPLHLNMVTAAIANDGLMMKPYVIDRVLTEDGRVLKRFSPKEMGSVLSAEEAEIMTGLMREVVQSGTGKRINDLPFTVAGKTGSAEFSTVKEQSHAWFTGFAPAEEPQIAVTVILENAGSGGEMAAPVAGQVFAAYFAEIS